MNENLSDKIALPYACVFPGSGSQYVGMGKTISSQFKVAHQVFLKATEILGYDIANICFHGGIVDLNRTKNCLIAVYLVSIAYFEVLRLHFQENPAIVAGHSVGEYAALTCVGAISFEECLKIVQYRAQLAEEANKAMRNRMGMSIVKGISPSFIESLCAQMQGRGCVSVACFNSEDQIMLSGEEDNIKDIEELIRTHCKESQIIPLASSPAFHSPLLKEASHKLKERLLECQWNEWSCPVISNTTAKPYNTKKEAIEHLTAQLYQPVQWAETIKFLSSQGLGSIVEVGPQTVLKQLNNQINLSFYSFDHPKDRLKLLSYGSISRN